MEKGKAQIPENYKEQLELKERKRMLETDQRHLEEFLINPDDPGRQDMKQRIVNLKKEIRQEKKLQKTPRIHGNHPLSE